MLTLTDLFCGAGGSSTGAIAVPGLSVRAASNHWSLAVETHNANHQDADHICADLSQISPAYFPPSDLLWASPECTNHSRAKGRKKDVLQTELWQETLPDEAAERSRATMWDVVRFTEYHRYRAVIVENVVEVADWLPFRAWLLAMDALGYDHQVISLNSMHAQAYGLPAPQSRDRVYIGFHRKGDHRPDFAAMQRPRAWCPSCDEVVESIQTFKRPGTNKPGRYRSQYFHRCPKHSCRGQQVEPAWLPASSIIDWTLTGERIGDRDRPLAAKTRARIAAGIARYWRSALAVPVEDRADVDRARLLASPLRTQNTRLETGLAQPPFVAELRGGGSTARLTEDPLATVTAGGNHHGLVMSYYGNNDSAKPTSAPVDTVTTTDRHALLTPADGVSPTAAQTTALVMRNNTGGAEMVTPAGQPIRTITTAGHQSILTPGDITAAEAQVDDVYFRMLEPSECKRAMAFPAEYRMLGNRREQVRLAGNAVTPPAARDLIATVAAALGVTA